MYTQMSTFQQLLSLIKLFITKNLMYFLVYQSYPNGSIHREGGSFCQYTKHGIFVGRRITVSNLVVVSSVSPIQFLTCFVA